MSNRISGTVARIDEHGRLITDIDIQQLDAAPRDESVTIHFGGHETVGLYPTPHDQPESTMVASLGSTGFLELEIVGMNLAEMLGIPTGTPVEVKWG